MDDQATLEQTRARIAVMDQDMEEYEKRITELRSQIETLKYINRGLSSSVELLTQDLHQAESQIRELS